jgi:hypothetical protein
MKAPAKKVPAKKEAPEPAEKAEAAPPPAPPKETPAQEAARKYKLKVNGSEVELDEAELLKKAELGYGAYSKFEEASKLRKDVQTFVKALRSEDPQVRAQALQAAGFDVQQYVDQYIEQMRQEAQLTPDQRERKRFETERQQWQQQKQQWESQQREAVITQQTAVVKQQYQDMFGKALGEAGVPDTGMQMVRMAKTIQTMREAGYPITPETAAHAAKIVAQEYRSEAEKYVSGLEVPALLELLGREKVAAIRKHFVDQARPQEAAPSTQAPTPKVQEPERKVSTEELRKKAFERRFG